MAPLPTCESQRDAVVAWLERSDNFLRVAPLFGASRRRQGNAMTGSDAVAAVQGHLDESQALGELAAWVNQASPRSGWDATLAKQMLRHFFMEFRATAAEASKPGFTLSRTDEVFGIQTIEEKLNHMCRHFVRLQRLYDPKRRSDVAENERKREKGVEGGAGGELRQKGTPVSSSQRQDRRGGRRESRRERDAGGSDVRESQWAEKEHLRGKMQLQDRRHSGGKKGAVFVKQQMKDKDAYGKGQRVRSPELIEIISDEDEEDEKQLTMSVIDTTDKRRKRVNTFGSEEFANNGGDEVLYGQKKKHKRAQVSARKPTGLEARRSVLQSEDIATQAEVYQTSSTNGRSLVLDEGQVRSRNQGGIDLRCIATTSELTEATSVSKFAGGGHELTESISLTSKPGQPRVTREVTPCLAMPQDTISTSTSPIIVTQDLEAPRSVASSSTSYRSTTQVSAASECDTQDLRTSELPVHNASDRSASPQLQCPPALHSAIAKIVSQCLDLLDFRFDRCPSGFCDSGIPPRKDEKEVKAAKVNACAKSSDSRHNGLSAFDLCRHRGVQVPPATTATTAQGSVKRDDHEIPIKSKTTSAKSSMWIDDHIPLLFDLPHCVSKNTDLETKRSYLTAKKLAFERFKWKHEKELQEQEMEVLRSEMEIRKVCAQKEIEYQQMSIRADVIYRMILTGASIEDTAERLAWL
uniref:Uncharacterized protein n=1 Tax=Hyaloperonospora arabidopsidis (strain Emoy2) TaxID=559515 RepID=M4BPA7_HYAAE